MKQWCPLCKHFEKQFGVNRCKSVSWEHPNSPVMQWLRKWMPDDTTRIHPDANGCPGFAGAIDDELTRPWNIHPWPSARIEASPFGSDLLLLIDRGIPCEAHVQVISTHCTNVPEERDVWEAVVEYREMYKQIFEGGVVASQHIPGGEEAGLILLRGILTHIAERAEKIQWEREMAAKEADPEVIE